MAAIGRISRSHSGKGELVLSSLTTRPIAAGEARSRAPLQKFASKGARRLAFQLPSTPLVGGAEAESPEKLTSNFVLYLACRWKSRGGGAHVAAL